MLAADWNALQGAIAGDVLFPESPEYELARKPPMARFWHLAPEAIVRCRAPEDVAAALGLARRSGLAVAVRSGGHCFAGRSSTRGILVDVGDMSAIAVADGTATVGAGVKLDDLYDALDAHGSTIAGGCGPSVGMAGLTLGGGLGILGRRNGLTSDQLLAADVVLADGPAVSCDEHHHADLFWGLRGAGGCRFGVVTSFVFRTVDAPDATSFDLRWPQSAAATIVDAWQDWSPEAPETVAASLLLTAGADPGRPVTLKVFGAMLGSEAEAERTLEGLVARADVDPVSATLEHLPYRETKRYLAEYDAGSTAKPEPGHLLAKSEFFRAPLPAETIAALVEHIRDGRRPGLARELDFTPWGGAYNRIRRDATAFVHRAERFLLKHEVVIEAERAETETQAAREWLTRSWALAHSSGTGGAYPNFPDLDLSPWDRAYHGANLDRLQRVKALYDPDGVFPVDRP